MALKPTTSEEFAQSARSSATLPPNLTDYRDSEFAIAPALTTRGPRTTYTPTACGSDSIYGDVRDATIARRR